MRFPAKKRWHSLLPSGCLGWNSSPPPTECADGRTYGCTDVRTDGHVTITSQPKFLGLIGYHISLAVELRWRALPAGSATNQFFFLIAKYFISICKLKECISKLNDFLWHLYHVFNIENNSRTMTELTSRKHFTNLTKRLGPSTQWHFCPIALQICTNLCFYSIL